jgi:type 2 lantibiotic biosynthesis protein LanM
VSALDGQSAKADHEAADSAPVTERMARWSEAAALGHPGAFLRRLAWDGLDDARARQAVGSPPVPLELPAWTSVLRRIAAVSADAEEVSRPRRRPEATRVLADGGDFALPIDPGAPLPFEEVWRPAVLVARQGLRARCAAQSGDLSWLSEPAASELERALLVHLTNLAAPALLAEFEEARPAGYGLLARLMDANGYEEPSSRHYRAFVDRLQREGHAAFFIRWPVLGRLSATLIDDWVQASAELLGRYAADREALSRLLGGGRTASPGVIAGVEPYLSDRHRGGRAVARLRFESGDRLVYKPRPMALEAALQGFLQWCNGTRRLPHPLKTVPVIDRGEYGWMAHVTSGPCDDERGVERFYVRAGMLLALVHLLHGTDCHWENLVADGEHPMLIDAEALLHHDPAPGAFGTGAVPSGTSLDDQFARSVLRTGLLPRWDNSVEGGIGLDISGLGGVGPTPPVRQRQWVAVNADSMRRVFVATPLHGRPNAPRLHDAPADPDRHVDRVVDGFKAFCDLVIAEREELLGPGGPLAAFADLPVRFVYRPTSTYQAVLNAAATPQGLRDGIDRSLGFEVLARAYLVSSDRPAAWPVLAAEIAALERFDVPHFSARTGGTRLDAGVRIEGFFEGSSYGHARQRIATLDVGAVAREVALVRGAFLARRAGRAEVGRASGNGSAADGDLDGVTPLTADALVAAAQDIARDLRSRAITASDGSVNWIGLARAANAERYQLQPLGTGLYSGAVGVSLFLAALDHVRGHDDYRDLADAALAPVVRALSPGHHAVVERWARDAGIGAGDGLGGIVYGLVRIAHFQGTEQPLGLARRVAGLITPEQVARDRMLDVILGSAGAILGLLALFQATGDPMALDRARSCADRLLAAREMHESGFRTWWTVERRPLTGFAHGAAGIAYALLRLHAHSPDPALARAAEEAIGFEDRCFAVEAGNWPDFRTHEGVTGPVYLANWCHGAAGITMARVHGLDVLDAPAVREDIERGIRTTQAWGLQDVDHLCCGNAGRADVLHGAGIRLRRPGLSDLARRQAAWIVDRAARTGGYWLIPGLADRVFSPGLFQGATGVGYAWLRLARPELPSLLAFE